MHGLSLPNMFKQCNHKSTHYKRIKLLLQKIQRNPLFLVSEVINMFNKIHFLYCTLTLYRKK